MTKLEAILAPFDVVGKLGSTQSFDRDYLRSTLMASSRQTAVAFWLAVVVQFALFVLAAWFALKNSGNPTAVSVILAGAGGGVGTCGYAMMRLWKQKVATDLTLGLVSSLNETTAMTVLNVVLEILRGDSKPAKARVASARRHASAG